MHTGKTYIYEKEGKRQIYMAIRPFAFMFPLFPMKVAGGRGGDAYGSQGKSCKTYVTHAIGLQMISTG